MENTLIYVQYDIFSNRSVLTVLSSDRYFMFEMDSKKMAPYPCVELKRPQVLELIKFLQESLLPEGEK